MSGKAPFLIILILSLRAEVVPIAQQEPQSMKGGSHRTPAWLLPSSALNQAHDFVKLFLIDLRTMLNCGLKRVTYFSHPSHSNTHLYKLVIYGFFNKRTRGSATALAHVTKESPVSTRNSLFDISSISKNYEWTFPSKL